MFHDADRSSHSKRKVAQCREGYIYIAVIMTAVIVSTLAMSSVWIARKHQLEQTAADEAYELASAADSAVELALARIAEDSAWRNRHVHNTEYGPFALGNISLFYRLLDSDGNIGSSRLKDISVIGIAKRGSASYAVQVDATPAGPAVTCLNHGIAVYGDIDLSYRTAWMTNGAVYSGDEISLDWEASITGNIIAVDTISGTYLNGPTTANAPSSSFGNASSVNRYSAEATNISISSLPTVSGRRQLSNCLLSPNHNPFGGTLNEKGIYRINCNGANLDIENCRILGTLVLENLGNDCKLKQNVYAEPAIKNYPSIYINGDIEIESRWGNFSEATLRLNLNPPGAPFQGSTNTSQTDVYPCRVDGIFYCRDELYFVYGSQLDVYGALVAVSTNTDESQTSLRVTYDSDIAANPPPGLRQDTIMRPIRGTYRRVATP
jgi:hypothetical protein